MKKHHPFHALCAAVLLFFSVVLIWYVISASSLASRHATLEEDLKTSRGREARQQQEYDQVAEKLPQVREQLAAQLPLTEELRQQADELKAEKKQLKKEKTALENRLKELQDQAPQETQEQVPSESQDQAPRQSQEKEQQQTQENTVNGGQTNEEK